MHFSNYDKFYAYQPNYLPTYNLNHPLLPNCVPKYLPKYVPNCMPNHLPNQFPRDAFRSLQSKHRGMQKREHFQKQTHKPKPTKQNNTKQTEQGYAMRCGNVQCPRPTSNRRDRCHGAESLMFVMVLQRRGRPTKHCSKKSSKHYSQPHLRQSIAAKSLPSTAGTSLPSTAAKSLPSTPAAKSLPIHTNTMQSNLIHFNQIKKIKSINT